MPLVINCRQVHDYDRGNPGFPLKLSRQYRRKAEIRKGRKHPGVWLKKDIRQEIKDYQQEQEKIDKLIQDIIREEIARKKRLEKTKKRTYTLCMETNQSDLETIP